VTVVSDPRDMGVFLARLVRLDASAVVRVRPTGTDHLTLWARLPFDVLAARTVAGDWPDDATVAAADLLAVVSGGGTFELPRRRDAEWRGSLPPERGWQHLDAIPADVVRKLVEAGGRAFRAAGDAVAQVAGESLLDHETLRVSGENSPEVAVPFRLLLGLARMAFLGEEPVTVAVVGAWVRLAADHGVVYRRTGSALLTD
jgi:hypothetical protein